MVTLRHRKIISTIVVLAAISHRAFAFGIDKLTLNVDQAKNFSSVSQVVIFNENDEVVYVTGRPLNWDTDASGAMLTTPTSDLGISPAVSRIPAKGSAVFTVKYIGPKRESEAHYRAAFREIRVPVKETSEDGSERVSSKIMAGLMMTIPVFVSDFTEKIEPFKDVTATYHRTEKGVSIIVKNEGNRHLIVESVDQGTEEIARLHNTIFSKKEMRYEITTAFDTTKGIDLDLTYGDDKKHISVLVEK